MGSNLVEFGSLGLGFVVLGRVEQAFVELEVGVG